MGITGSLGVLKWRWEQFRSTNAETDALYKWDSVTSIQLITLDLRLTVFEVQ